MAGGARGGSDEREGAQSRTNVYQCVCTCVRECMCAYMTREAAERFGNFDRRIVSRQIYYDLLYDANCTLAHTHTSTHTRHTHAHTRTHTHTATHIS